MVLVFRFCLHVWFLMFCCRYYCIFHANEERRRSDGGFMGLEESSEEDDDEDARKLFQTDLLTGFANWMDRLCEGSLRRFRVEYWPSMNYSSWWATWWYFTSAKMGDVLSPSQITFVYLCAVTLCCADALHLWCELRDGLESFGPCPHLFWQWTERSEWCSWTHSRCAWQRRLALTGLAFGCKYLVTWFSGSWCGDPVICAIIDWKKCTGIDRFIERSSL